MIEEETVECLRAAPAAIPAPPNNAMQPTRISVPLIDNLAVPQLCARRLMAGGRLLGNRSICGRLR
ncbi:MAG: hypothetical protein ND895_03725 [Pyrinomonadaceae bacterium]|nr:hypothetical protein [Pyrinomonadaceae bacterium]